MAMDFLPIQATSVPCERVFSSSADTDTKKRNRILPDLMEALQIYKFGLKHDTIDFTSGLVSLVEDLQEDTPDRGQLQKVLEGNAQAERALYSDEIV